MTTASDPSGDSDLFGPLPIQAPATTADSAMRRSRTPSDKPSPQVPLAERMRPATLDEVIGQQHLLGPGKPLRTAFESGRLHSMILWGPPGVGKTTLARLMADAFDAQFIAADVAPVLSNVKVWLNAPAAAVSDLIAGPPSGLPAIRTFTR